MVQPLSEGVRQVVKDHLGGWPASAFELHGQHIWNGTGYWKHKNYDELIAAYKDAITLLGTYNISVAHASINKQKLVAQYGNAAEDPYMLALQFLLEKVDALGINRKVLVADEAKEHQLVAVKMVADMKEWGSGVIPGKKLASVIDSLHYVSSHASPGVQMADLVAFVLQRRLHKERHPNAQAALDRLSGVVDSCTVTWRETWP